MPEANKNPLQKIYALIANETVRTELGLEGPELKNFKESFEVLRDTFREKIGELQQKPKSQIMKQRPELLKKLESDAGDVMAEILPPDQLARFHEIKIQREGIAAVLDARIRDQLSIADDQMRKLKVIVETGVQRISAAHNNEASAQGKTPGEVEEDAKNQVVALLSEEQRAKWDAMQGEKFDFGDAAVSEATRSEATAEETTSAADHDEAEPIPQSSGPHEFDLDLLNPLESEQQYFLTSFVFHAALAKRFEAPSVQCLRGDDESQQMRLAEAAKFYVESNSSNSERHTAETYREILLRLSQSGTIANKVHAKYSSIVQLFPDDWWTFLNYGFVDPFDPPDDTDWTETEKLWRHSAALYQLTLSQAEIKGKDVVEVGCGRGGGAAWIARHLEPNSVRATDGTKSNVLFGQSTHDVPGLEYSYGLATDLPLPDESADIVLSMESCSYYKPLSAFVAESARVLRPGGRLLIAAWGPPKLFRELQDAAQVLGLSFVTSRDISTGVCLSLEAFDAVSVVANNPTGLSKWLYLDVLQQTTSVPTIKNGSTPYMTLAFEKLA